MAETDKSIKKRDWRAIWSPIGKVPSWMRAALTIGWMMIGLLFWIWAPFKIIPPPWEVARAFVRLFTEQNILTDLSSSFVSNIEALTIATALSLLVSWSALVPALRPLAHFVSLLRFLSLTGLTLLFTIMIGGGHVLKISLLVYAISANFVTSQLATVLAIPREEFDQARTLHMSPWRTWFEVVVMGTLDHAFENLRQNAAIGWMMLTTVEGIVRSEGGLGKVMLDENKQFRLEYVYALIILTVLIGLLQDKVLSYFRRLVCPYAVLNTEEDQ